MNDRAAGIKTTRKRRGLLLQWLVLTLWSAIACLVIIAAEAAPLARSMAAMPGGISIYEAARVTLALRAPLFVLAPFAAAFALRFCPGRVRWRLAIPAGLIAASLGSGFVILTEDEISTALAPEQLRSEGDTIVFDDTGPSGELKPALTPSGSPVDPLVIFGPGSPDEFPSGLAPGSATEALAPPPELLEALAEAAETQIVEVHTGDSMAWHFGQHFLEVFVFLGVALVPALALLSGERERLRIDTERELATTENHLLRAQLQPHFLFNALNGIQVLVDTDPERAKGVVQRLSGLLRATLREASQPLIPLGTELAVLDDYLAIERLRFGDRVRFAVGVEPDLEHFEVPSFSLQPLVENALRYGAGARSEGGGIQVDIRRAGQKLRLEVLDDGPGFKTGFVEGHGLGTLRQRLARHFGPTADLSIQSDNDQTSVVVTIPLRSSRGESDV